MTRNQEPETAYQLWELLGAMQNLLFDLYGEDFVDLYAEEQAKKANLLPDDMDWPF